MYNRILFGRRTCLFHCLLNHLVLTMVLTSNRRVREQCKRFTGSSWVFVEEMNNATGQTCHQAHAWNVAKKSDRVGEHGREKQPSCPRSCEWLTRDLSLWFALCEWSMWDECKLRDNFTHHSAATSEEGEQQLWQTFKAHYEKMRVASLQVYILEEITHPKLERSCIYAKACERSEERERVSNTHHRPCRFDTYTRLWH